MTAIDSLRNGTSELHSKLDSLPGIGELMSPTINLSTYTHALKGLYTSFLSAERAITELLSPEQQAQWQFESSLAKLKTDLQNLNALTDTGSAHFSLSTESEAVGAIYVLLGSSLGGAMIAKQLASRLQIDENSGLLFYGSSASAHPRWREFKTLLEKSYPAGDSRIPELVSGAQKTFHLFTRAFAGE